MAKPKNKKQCIIKDCEGKSDSRGLCSRCYAAAHKMIKEKKTTWDQLSKLGLVEGKPEQSKNAFMRAFNEVFNFKS